MKLLTFFLFVLSLITVTAQTPTGFNYQAVVRNNSGEIIANSAVALRISILQDSESGSVIYSEVHNTTTNQFGLVNLVIGEGSNTAGIFSPGGWGVNKHFLKIELDSNGGDSFVYMGTSQLLAVPYAFHAQTVAEDNVDDADADPINEIQTISISGTELTLSDGGGTVELPTTGEGTGDITAVNAGTGLEGGGTSGDVTLDVEVPLHLIGSTEEVIKGTHSSGNYGYLGGGQLGVYGNGNTFGVYGNGYWGVSGN